MSLAIGIILHYVDLSLFRLLVCHVPVVVDVPGLLEVRHVPLLVFCHVLALVADLKRDGVWLGGQCGVGPATAAARDKEAENAFGVGSIFTEGVISINENSGKFSLNVWKVFCAPNSLKINNSKMVSHSNYKG
jgi:hypothetical protein